MGDEQSGAAVTRSSWRSLPDPLPIVAPVPQFRPLRSDAYEALREAILLQRLRPGQRVVEAEIAMPCGQNSTGSPPVWPRP